jgi:branched-chain amino acid transport system ATP-binding protein
MLEARNLSVSYGQHRALENASVRVGRGEIVVILGANGAGKSTLLKAIAGICEGRVAGSVQLDGLELTGLSADKIVEEGIALVPEGRGIFGELTVRENLLLGAYSARARDEEAANLDKVHALFPKLRERERQTVRTMSGGEQQMVAIGRAMMSNPQILALDEPSLGLSPLLCKELFQSLKTIRETGIGILLVEQNAKQSLAIADRGYLLENGQIVHAERAEALMNDPAVRKAYLGGGGAAAPMTHRGADVAASTRAAPAAAPRTAAAPRPVAQSPSEIAAAAMQRFAKKPSAPALAPSPTPAPPAAAAPDRETREKAGSPPGIEIEDLVARAQAKPAQTVTPRRPNGPAAGAVVTHRSDVPMPDLGDGADRLRAALSEIEEASARAQAYRPPGRKK